MTRATLCSRNAHKARELERLLPGWTIVPLERDDYPPETGATYYDNARLKAEFGRAHSAGWVLAEDSGLEVDALGGRPGVHSARYAAEAVSVAGRAGDARPVNPFAFGEGGGAPAIAKLLGELGDGTERAARYVSELVLLAPDGTEYRGTGTLDGRIASEPSGTEGFGYDPVFVPTGEELTVAKLGNEWKALNSHRARAAQALLRALADAPATTS